MKNIVTFDELLKPNNQPIVSKGQVMYYERFRSRCLILLKKEVREAFNALQDKHAQVNYAIEYYRTQEEFMQRIQKILDKNQGLPFLLFLSKDGDQYVQR